VGATALDLGVKAGRIDISGWGVTTCTLVAYVSDSTLLCLVPPLSSRTHDVDKEERKVNVQVTLYLNYYIRF
jgi:hypothetical protein